MRTLDSWCSSSLQINGMPSFPVTRTSVENLMSVRSDIYTQPLTNQVVASRYYEVSTSRCCVTQKPNCCHFDEIFIIDRTESCQFDNFRCSQWWKCRPNDDISVLVDYTMFETSADFGPKITNVRTILDLNNFRTNDLMIKQVCVNQNHLVWNQRDASVKYDILLE